MPHALHFLIYTLRVKPRCSVIWRGPAVHERFRELYMQSKNNWARMILDI